MAVGQCSITSNWFRGALFGVYTKGAPYISSLARRDAHVEVVGFDSQGLLDLELIIGVMGADIEVLEDLIINQAHQRLSTACVPWRQ
jgi:hypothetical protein